MSAGYSGTPLARKLSLKDGQRVCFQDMPASVRRDIDAAGLVLREVARGEVADAVHVFATARARLAAAVVAARGTMAQDGFIWASWPKKAAKVPTDITEDVVREIALPLGLVDVKVCAVDGTWSALKLVIRKELRTG